MKNCKKKEGGGAGLSIDPAFPEGGRSRKNLEQSKAISCAYCPTFNNVNA